MIAPRIAVPLLLLFLLAACDGGGNTPTPPVQAPQIEVSGSTVQVSAQAGSAAQTQSVTVRNSGGGTLSWNAVSGAGWISVSPASGSLTAGQSASLTITANPAGLAAATHTATVTISSGTPGTGSQSITVTLVVTPAPALSLATESLVYASEAGTNPAPQTLSISNSGAGTLSWSASEELSWLAVSPASGSLAGGQSSSVAVTVSTVGLNPGTYSGTINFSAPGASGAPRSVAVSLTVTPAPSIAATPSSLQFTAQQGSNPAGQTLTISNAGGGTLTWTASESLSWLVGSPASGALAPGQSGTINLTVSTAGLEPGTYSGAITISAPGATNSPALVSVSLVVTAAPLPVLNVSPASLSFSAPQGSNPANQTLTISNTGQGTLSWTASESLSWLSGSPASGSLVTGQTAAVTFAVNTAGLVSGTYSGAITVSGPGATGSPRSIPVTLTVTATPGVLEVAPSALVYSGSVGGSAPALSFTITNSGGSPFSWTAASSVAWVTLSPTSGTLAAGASTTVTVTLSTTGLPAGTSSGLITVTAPGATGTQKAITVTVNLSSSLLPAPVLTSPANGAPGVPRSPTLTWNAVSGANRYWVTIAASAADLPTNPSASTCTGCVVSANTSGTSFAVPTPLDANKTYYWRIQGYNNSTNPITQGQFSEIRNFTTIRPAPQLWADGVKSSTRLAGQTFNLTGSGFTPNGKGTRYVRNPDGSQVNIGTTDVSGTGTIGWSWPTDCATTTGTYRVWVIDSATNVSSDTVSETVTSSPNCTSPSPSISTLTPNPVPADNVTREMTLTGTGFGPGLRVFYRNRYQDVELPSSDITVISATQARVRVNLGATPASWFVSVRGPSGARSSEVVFRTIGNDYPSRWITSTTVRPCSTLGDDYGFVLSNCTSFVAWRLDGDGKKILNNHGVAYTCSSADSWSNGVRFTRWTDAACWDESARALGKRVDRSPAVGAVAQWNTSGGGHVAYVAAVYLDRGVVLVEEYNGLSPCRYGTREIPISQVANFIHF